MGLHLPSSVAGWQTPLWWQLGQVPIWTQETTVQATYSRSSLSPLGQSAYLDTGLTRGRGRCCLVNCQSWDVSSSSLTGTSWHLEGVGSGGEAKGLTPHLAFYAMALAGRVVYLWLPVTCKGRWPHHPGLSLSLFWSLLWRVTSTLILMGEGGWNCYHSGKLKDLLVDWSSLMPNWQGWCLEASSSLVERQ